jgi:hypothetical protein
MCHFCFQDIKRKASAEAVRGALKIYESFDLNYAKSVAETMI